MLFDIIAIRVGAVAGQHKKPKNQIKPKKTQKTQNRQI
jgi:hypothetical protein